MLRDPKNDTWYDRNICRSSEKMASAACFNISHYQRQVLNRLIQTQPIIANFWNLLYSMKSSYAKSVCIDGSQLIREVWGPKRIPKTGGSDACTAPRLALTARLKLQGGQSKVCELCRLQKASKGPKKQVCIGPIQRPGEFSCYTSVFLSFTCTRSCSRFCLNSRRSPVTSFDGSFVFIEKPQ